MRQQEYHGFRSIANLREVLNQEDAQNIFLVTGRKSYESCGAQQALSEELQGRQFTRFSDFSPNPKLNQIREGLKIFKKQNYDALIAIGGGSAIDVAKAIKMFYCDETGKKVPLVAIPTTAGSGSEATYFIVYYVGKKKQSAGKPELTLPEYAICDPQFTLSLPKHIAASTGMDALGQAVESYWSINSTAKSKKFAGKAIQLLMGNLEKAVNSPSSESKEKVMVAANLAGKAINITKTTACHAVAYPITSYFEVPHGHAVGLTIGQMLVYNSKVSEEDCNDARGIEYVRGVIDELVKLIGAGNPEKTKEKISRMMKAIGLKNKLSELGIDSRGVELIIENGFTPERVKNNPRELTSKTLREILQNIY